MSPANVFRIDLPFGFLAWGCVTVCYLWPYLRTRSREDALRLILCLHAFRYEGLSFLLVGIVAPTLPGAFAEPAAFGDLLAAGLAVLSLLTLRTRVGTLVVWAFNLAGITDLVMNTYRTVALGLPDRAGELGATYYIIVFYVPLLFITHLLTFRILLDRNFGAKANPPLASPALA